MVLKRMLHFEQRRCERHNREFNRFLTYIRIFFYHVPLYIMMCDNKDFIIIIIDTAHSTIVLKYIINGIRPICQGNQANLKVKEVAWSALQDRLSADC